MNPEFLPGHRGLLLAYDAKGLHEEAIASSQEAIKISGNASLFLTDLAQMFAHTGKTAEARAILGQLCEISKERYVDAGSVGRVYAALTERDQAFRCLEKAYQEHAPSVAYMRGDPWLAPFAQIRASGT